MRAVVLTPAPDFWEEWDWAYDVEAAALRAGGIEVEPRPWTDVGDLAGIDAVLPLVAGEHHQVPAVPPRDVVAGLDTFHCRECSMPSARPSTADKRKAFRVLHQSGCFVIPNPFDVGSAVALQHLGFKALASTSAGFAWTLGKADNRVTLDFIQADQEFIIEHYAFLVSEEDFDWLFSINFFGVVHMTRTFLPLLRASDDARGVLRGKGGHDRVGPPARRPGSRRPGSRPRPLPPCHRSLRSLQWHLFRGRS